MFRYKSGEIQRRHFAIIGTATVVDGYPLYYDALNEHGLCVAGLNFVDNFSYYHNDSNTVSLAPYELIPYLLSNCKNVEEAIECLGKISVVDLPFVDYLQNAELHWLISDKNRSITLEYMKGEMHIHENDIGVLTNNPPFEYQLMNLNNYLNITNEDPSAKFSTDIIINKYSRGMGGIGLPGDNSSMSRFVRASFIKLNSVVPNDEIECVTQFFHILNSVEQQEGSVIFHGKYEKTQYSSCCNSDKGIYYYRTYDNSQITAISLFNEELDSSDLISYKMKYAQQIEYVN